MKSAVKKKSIIVAKPAAIVKPAARKVWSRMQFVDNVDYKVPMDLSVLDWQDRVRNYQSLMPQGLRLDMHRAARARQVFELLQLPDVAGTPSFGEVGGEWIIELVQAVFGSWNGKVRGVNEFFELIAKKNSKTTNGSGIMVTALIMNERPRAEFLMVAPTQQIAKLAFEQAVGMVEADPYLRKKFHIKEYIKQIEFIESQATLKVKSFDPQVMTGVKPAGILMDELHVIAEHANADRVIGQMRGGMVSQPEAFLIFITTQSERPPKGIFRTELNKARKIRDGQIKGLKTLARLYEFPDDIVRPGKNGVINNKWRNPEVWPMVLPNNGKSVTVERLYEDYRIAIESGEEEVRRWASQHLNVEIGIGLTSDSWVGANYWLAAERVLSFEQLLEESECLTMGIDGGGLDDMLAISVIGRNKETRKWHIWVHAWLIAQALDRNKNQISSFRDFESAGDLTIVEKFGIDLEQLGDYSERVLATGKMNKVGVDPAGISSILEELIERKFDPEKHIVAIRQGWSLTSAIGTMERKLADGTLTHSVQGLSRYAVENAKVEPRGNAVIITKGISGRAKIDPLMATLNAIELMSRVPDVKSANYGVFFLGGN